VFLKSVRPSQRCTSTQEDDHGSYDNMTEAHEEQDLQPYIRSQGPRHPCAILFMDMNGHIAAAFMPSYLGHSHVDTNHMITKGCPHQWF